MIILRIQGGLGNQMFQWACGRNLSIQRKSSLSVEVLSYQFDIKRSFRLNLFKNISKSLNLDVNIYDKWIPRGPQIVNDDFKTFSFPSGSVYLDGYWQSELFFKNNSKEIKKDFDLSDFYYIIDKFPQIKDSVSLHIRRTDYITSNGFHPVQPIDYYLNGLESLNKDYENIFVFSDDIDWCRENIKLKSCLFMDNQTDFESLCLMSHAKHNIIANSSFSWWAAWLNETPSKKVIAPKTWFGEASNLESNRITPETWILI